AGVTVVTGQEKTQFGGNREWLRAQDAGERFAAGRQAAQEGGRSVTIGRGARLHEPWVGRVGHAFKGRVGPGERTRVRGRQQTLGQFRAPIANVGAEGRAALLGSLLDRFEERELEIEVTGKLFPRERGE